MEELTGRLMALDPEAEAAVRAIAYFDRLVQDRAGLEAVVRGAALLSDCAARLVTDEYRVRVRIAGDGRRTDVVGVPDPRWPGAPLIPGGPPALWLERDGCRGTVDTMVLERAAVAARIVLERTRGVAIPRPGGHDDGGDVPQDPGLVELVTDATAPTAARLDAASRLGLAGPVRAVALPADGRRVIPADASEGLGGTRAGIGPATPPEELPASYHAARVALRFTADGTEQDPGAPVVYAERLGGLTVLAAAIHPGSEPVPDVRALQDASARAPWVLATLAAAARHTSLRSAAASLRLHHSSYQERLDRAERLLGWTLRDADGRLRLQLALAMRLLHRPVD